MKHQAKSLIQRQEEALARMAEPRTSERRARKHCAVVLKRYRQEAARLGYSPVDIEAQVRDIRDMHELRQLAEE